MSRVAYVNGQYVPLSHATVSMMDRGYLFADGVYEVVALYRGALLDEAGHLDRLERSLAELSIPMPMTRRALELAIRELMRQHPQQKNGLIYMQVTRGEGVRNHLYAPNMKPALAMALLAAKYPTAAERDKGGKVITAPDMRWARCDIKSTALLPNIMTRNHGATLGAKEVWQLNRDGQVTEGSYSNAYIVDARGTVRTHPKSHAILGGITRDTVLRLARETGIAVVEEPFTPADIAKASEAFMSSASSFVFPITQVDAVTLPVGPITRRLMGLYDAYIESLTHA